MVQSSKLMYFRAPGNLKKEKNISETQAIDMTKKIGLQGFQTGMESLHTILAQFCFQTLQDFYKF